MSNSLIVAICAPSAGGKTTQINLLRGRRGLTVSISDTTRSPRPVTRGGPMEENGVHYNFITIPEFESRVGNDVYAEYACVYGNYYGTPAKFLFDALEARTILILNIDIQGFRSIKRHKNPQLAEAVKGIFLMPPSMEVLEERMRGRDGKLDKNRLEIAEAEMACAPEFDLVVTTHEQERTYGEIIRFIELHS